MPSELLEEEILEKKKSLQNHSTDRSNCDRIVDYKCPGCGATLVEIWYFEDRPVVWNCNNCDKGPFVVDKAGR